VETVEYAPGRLADTYGEISSRRVLLWHGAQTNARATVRLLAEMLACRGANVIVPDWNSHSSDGGRADLLNSIDFARGPTAHPDGLVLVGWSLGGAAAAGLSLHPQRFGVALVHTVCIAGAFMAREPITGGQPLAQVPNDGAGVSFTLLHGVKDDVVPVTISQSFASRLREVGWPVEVIEVDADHGAIAGATYDPISDRYASAQDTETRAVASDVAARIASVLAC